jgi:hypothetical protein
MESVVMTREEHLQWAKDRAIEYADAGDTHNAFTTDIKQVVLKPGERLA